ncbi:GYF domain-containing protein [Besnoitia besnoiti]|uniref:GYF domain-containing protein n=1 Tax=Besnoitia besnoiti TaxID=94643 RepID=A0A2A9M8X6_BESBE|nr:GYF domain-containing protein [Besnoitia besnoiti]PFH34938.1 GYF domain-containing protein [Besnoitia besnoiti]
MYQPRPFTGVNRARAAAAAASPNPSGSSSTSTGRVVRMPIAAPYAQQPAPLLASGEKPTVSGSAAAVGSVIADTADFPVLANPLRGAPSHHSAPADSGSSPSSQKGQRRGGQSSSATDASAPANPWQQRSGTAAQPSRQHPSSSGTPVSSLAGFFPGAQSRQPAAVDAHTAMQRNLQRMQLPPAPSSRSGGGSSAAGGSGSASGRGAGAWGASAGAGESAKSLDAAGGGAGEGGSERSAASGPASWSSAGPCGGGAFAGSSPTSGGSHRNSLGSSGAVAGGPGGAAAESFAPVLRAVCGGSEGAGRASAGAFPGNRLPGEGAAVAATGKEAPSYEKLPLLAFWQSARSLNDAAAARTLATTAPGQVTEQQQLLFRLVVREAPPPGAGTGGPGAAGMGLGGPQSGGVGAGLASGGGLPGRGRRGADGDWHAGDSYGERHDVEGSEHGLHAQLQPPHLTRGPFGAGKLTQEEAGARGGGRLGLGLAAAFGVGTEGPPAGRGRGRGEHPFGVEGSVPGASFPTRGSLPPGTRGAAALRPADGQQPPPGGMGRGSGEGATESTAFSQRWRFASEGTGGRDEVGAGDGQGSYRGAGAQTWMGAGRSRGRGWDAGASRGRPPPSRGGGRGPATAGAEGQQHPAGETLSGERRGTGGRFGALASPTGAASEGGGSADEGGAKPPGAPGAAGIGARGVDDFRRWGMARASGQGGRGSGATPSVRDQPQGPVLERSTGGESAEKGRDGDYGRTGGPWADVSGLGGRKREEASGPRSEIDASGYGEDAAAAAYGAARRGTGGRQSDVAEPGSGILHRPGNRSSFLTANEDDSSLPFRGDADRGVGSRSGPRAGSGLLGQAAQRGAPEAQLAPGVVRKKATDEDDWELIRRERWGAAAAGGSETREDPEAGDTGGAREEAEPRSQARPASSSLMGDPMNRPQPLHALSGSRGLEPPPARGQAGLLSVGEGAGAARGAPAGGQAAGFWSDEPIIKRRHRPSPPAALSAGADAQSEASGAARQGGALTPSVQGGSGSRVVSPRAGTRPAPKKHGGAYPVAIAPMAPSPRQKSPVPASHTPRGESPRPKASREGGGLVGGRASQDRQHRPPLLSREHSLSRDVKGTEGEPTHSSNPQDDAFHTPGMLTPPGAGVRFPRGSQAAPDRAHPSEVDAMGAVPSYLQHLLGGVLEDALASSSTTSQGHARAPRHSAGGSRDGASSCLLPFPAGSSGASGVAGLPGLSGVGAGNGGRSSEVGGLPPHAAAVLSGAAGALLGARPGAGTGVASGGGNPTQSQVLAAQKHQLLQLLHRRPQQANDRAEGALSLLGAAAAAASARHPRVQAQPHQQVAGPAAMPGRERGLPSPGGPSQLPGVFRQLLGLEQQRLASEQSLLQLREVGAGGRAAGVDPSSLMLEARKQLEEQTQREHLQQDFYGSHHGLGHSAAAGGPMMGGPGAGLVGGVHQQLRGAGLQSEAAALVSRGLRGERQGRAEPDAVNFHAERGVYGVQHPGDEHGEPRRGQREERRLEGPKFADDTPRWYYRDPSGEVQGPFPPSLMHQWWQLEFFPPHLKMRCDLSHPWLAFGDLYPLGGDEPFTTLPSPQRLARLHHQQLEQEMLQHQRRLREEQERQQEQQSFLPAQSSAAAQLHPTSRASECVAVHPGEPVEHARQADRGAAPGSEGGAWTRAAHGVAGETSYGGGADSHGRAAEVDAQRAGFWKGQPLPEAPLVSQRLPAAGVSPQSAAFDARGGRVEPALEESALGSDPGGVGERPGNPSVRVAAEANAALAPEALLHREGGSGHTANSGLQDGGAKTAVFPVQGQAVHEKPSFQPQEEWEHHRRAPAETREAEGDLRQEDEEKASPKGGLPEEKGAGAKARSQEKATDAATKSKEKAQEKLKPEAASQRRASTAGDEGEFQPAHRKGQQAQGKQGGKAQKGDKAEAAQKAPTQLKGEAPAPKDSQSAKKKQGKQTEAAKPQAAAHSQGTKNEQASKQPRASAAAQASGVAAAGSSNAAAEAAAGKKVTAASWSTMAAAAAAPSESLKDVMQAEQKKAEQVKKQKEEEARQKAAASAAAAAAVAPSRKTGWAVSPPSPTGDALPSAALALASDAADFPDLQIAISEGGVAPSAPKKPGGGAGKPRGGGERGTTKSLQEFVAVVSAQKREQQQSVWGQQLPSVAAPVASILPGAAAPAGSQRASGAAPAALPAGAEKTKGEAAAEGARRASGESYPTAEATAAVGGWSAGDNELAGGGKAKQQKEKDNVAAGKETRATEVMPERYKEQVEEWKMLMEQTKLQLDLSVIEYLATFTSEGEIVDFLAPNVEDGSQLETFARQLLSINTHFSTTRPHGKKGHGGGHGSAANDDDENRVPGAAPRKSQGVGDGASAGRGGSGSGGGRGGKKKKVQGKTVDPSMLGFSVRSNRILQGTIDRGTD